MTALLATILTYSLLGFDREDRIAVMFCGSQKSLITAVPMASVLFPAATVGLVLIPIMIYHPMQLVVGAWLARRLAKPAGELIIPMEPTTIMQATAARVPDQAR
jgi:solute carrier family 10 (sodium/bile acid cotransporter), member 7